MSKEKGDIERAKRTIARVEEELEALRVEAEDEVAALEDDFEDQVNNNTEKLIRARASNIQVEFVGVGWQPFLVKNS